MLVQECALVWRVTPDISFDLAKVTVVARGLHLTLPRSWLLQLFFPWLRWKSGMIFTTSV